MARRRWSCRRRPCPSSSPGRGRSPRCRDSGADWRGTRSSALRSRRPSRPPRDAGRPGARRGRPGRGEKRFGPCQTRDAGRHRRCRRRMAIAMACATVSGLPCASKTPFRASPDGARPGPQVRAACGRPPAVPRSRARDQHDRGLPGVLQRGNGRRVGRLVLLQAGERPEAGVARGVGRQELVPGRGQGQQAQRVSGRRGVEHHMLEVAGVAAAGQEFAKASKAAISTVQPPENCSSTADGRVRQDAPVRADHPLPVRRSSGFRVHVQGEQSGHARDLRGELVSGVSSTSSRLDAGSVLTSSTR